MRKLYIAAPFFTPDQLALVATVEAAIRNAGLEYYSPRRDGVLQDMTPIQRREAGPRLFKLNIKMIEECNAVLALKDFSDSGTTWETGYAYAIGQPIYGYRSRPEPLNIMVVQSFTGVLYGWEELEAFLKAYAGGGSLNRWRVDPTERIF